MFRLAISSLLFSLAFGEPNPPTWPDNVKVLGGNDSETQQVIDTIFAENGGHTPAWHGQWSPDRYALLFLPGTHNVNVNVGYYTSVIGLGQVPSDTKISNVICENGAFTVTGGALANFWRSAENFYTKPTNSYNNHVTMVWAVSQAAPLRRVIVDGALDLFEWNPGNGPAGYASGGFMADSTVTGIIQSGSQQQFLARNVAMGEWKEGVWNMVFVGCEGGPQSHCSNANGSLPNTVVPQTPVIAEKAFIWYSNGKYMLQIPPVETNKVGPSKNYAAGRAVDFSNVYVATEKDSASTINGKLAEGLHLVLCAGNYELSEAIAVTKANTVVIGIGFPTLISAAGNAVLKVANVAGVRVSGLLLQAGPKATDTLLEWGSGFYAGNVSNPGVMHDVFARVGGPTNSKTDPVQTKKMVEINSGNVIYDNAWLWRADHDVGGLVTDMENPVDSGIVVNGNNVIAYGLAAEHTLKDLVQWNGNNGQVFFYQSEFPYDATQAAYGDKGYVSYRVNQTVTQHHGYGIGVYCFFRDHSVTVANGIVSPTGSGIGFTNSLSVFLNGNGGQITHVINNQGSAVAAIGQQAWVCNI